MLLDSTMTSYMEGSIWLNLNLPNAKILSLIVDNLLKKVLLHDTSDFDRQFNIINNKAVRAPTKQH